MPIGDNTAQLQAIRAEIEANPVYAEHLASGNDVGIRDLLNQVASPNYWAWRSTVTRSAVYFSTSPTGSTFNFATYKTQSAPEQNAWTQMFMGDLAPCGNVVLRAGVHAVFSGSAPQVAVRDHCFAVFRRQVTRAERLFVTAVVAPPANTGNDTGQARGSAANPDNLGWEGLVTTVDVGNARVA